MKAKLPLSQWVYHCDAFGVSMDRDFNAAHNLAALDGQIRGGVLPELRGDKKRAHWKPK